MLFKRRKGFCGCGPKLDKDLATGVFYVDSGNSTCHLHDV